MAVGSRPTGCGTDRAPIAALVPARGPTLGPGFGGGSSGSAVVTALPPTAEEGGSVGTAPLPSG
jgi:hypothetical protein